MKVNLGRQLSTNYIVLHARTNYIVRQPETNYIVLHARTNYIVQAETIAVGSDFCVSMTFLSYQQQSRPRQLKHHNKMK